MKYQVFSLFSIALLLMFVLSCTKRIALHSYDQEKRIAAIKKITDQGLLKQICLRNNESREVRLQAFDQISDVDFIKSLIINWNEEEWLAEIAIGRIDDELFLKGVAKSSKYSKTLRDTATSRISNQNYLSEIAKYINEANIKSQDSLKNIVNNKSLTDDHRLDALKKITDQSYLKLIVEEKGSTNDIYPFYKPIDIALKGIINDDTLFSLVKDGDCWLTFKVTAIEQIRNQDVIKKIIEDNDINWIIRKEAYKNYTDPSISLELLNEYKDDKSKIIDIVFHAKDSSLIWSIAKGRSEYLPPVINMDTYVRANAVLSLNNKVKLIHLGVSTDTIKIREVASKKLQILLGGVSYTSDEFKELPYFNEVFSLLLEPEVVKRYGILKMTISESKEKKEYVRTDVHPFQRTWASGGKVTLTLINKTLKLTDDQGKDIFHEQFMAKAWSEEYFSSGGPKTRVADINFINVKNFLETPVNNENRKL